MLRPRRLRFHSVMGLRRRSFPAFHAGGFRQLLILSDPITSNLFLTRNRVYLCTKGVRAGTSWSSTVRLGGEGLFSAGEPLGIRHAGPLKNATHLPAVVHAHTPIARRQDTSCEH